MNRVQWRWEDRDLGFRFRTGKGRQSREYYQGSSFSQYYPVPGVERKISAEQMEDLAIAAAPATFQVVANPWRNYDREWDWIVTEDGICLNWAGCLDQEEIHRREDEGVQRAMELVAKLVEREQPVPLSQDLVKQVHIELMGAIYPFAGTWRTVAYTRATVLPSGPCLRWVFNRSWTFWNGTCSGARHSSPTMTKSCLTM